MTNFTFNRDAYHASRRRTGILRAAAAKNSNALGPRTARKLLAASQALESPVEVARKRLQRAGWTPVYNASVIGGPRDMWIVGSRRVTTEEMIQMAGER